MECAWKGRHFRLPIRDNVPFGALFCPGNVPWVQGFCFVWQAGQRKLSTRRHIRFGSLPVLRAGVTWTPQLRAWCLDGRRVTAKSPKKVMYVLALSNLFRYCLWSRLLCLVFAWQEKQFKLSQGCNVYFGWVLLGPRGPVLRIRVASKVPQAVQGEAWVPSHLLITIKRKPKE